MSTVDLEPLVDDGLGNSAYLVDLGDGRALAVDVSLDLRSITATTQRRGITVAFAADTHLHADFLSGARQLRASDGARVLASAAGNREFAHTGVRDGDEIDLGGLRLQALATPGHTQEHLSFLLLDADRPVGVFTGGSLLVGAAARTDLISPAWTETLARQQYASLQRLVNLPDDVEIWPTHGAGSFCSAPPGAQRTSTIGEQKRTNPLLQVPDEDAFVTALIDSLGSFPSYFLRLAELNRLGPSLLTGEPHLPALDAARVRQLLNDGAQVIDVRPIREFATGHIPGALSIPLRAAFASWLGWIAPVDRPLIIVRNGEQDPAEIAWQATKIGYTNLTGELAGGLPAWTAEDHPTTTIRLIDAGRIGTDQHVLDVRQSAEYAAGHLPGATHIELGALPARTGELPPTSTAVMCGHGERAMGAASLLEHAGHRDITVLEGGPDDWATTTGGQLETGT